MQGLVLQVLRHDQVRQGESCLSWVGGLLLIHLQQTRPLASRFDMDGDTVYCFDCDRDHPPLTSDHPDAMDVS